MILILWKGLGILLIPIVIISNLIASLIAKGFGANVQTSGKAYAWGGALIAAGLTCVLEKYYLMPRWAKLTRNLIDPKTNEQVVYRPVDSLFLIPVVLWIPLFLVLAVVFGIIAIVN